MTWIAIPLSLFAVGATFAGGFAAFRLRSRLEALLALSGGVVVAVALFDVLPEAIDQVHDSRRLSLLVGAGFLTFFLAERLLHLHDHGEGEHAHAKAPSRLGPLGAGALRALVRRRPRDRLAFSSTRRRDFSSSSPSSATISRTGSTPSGSSCATGGLIAGR